MADLDKEIKTIEENNNEYAINPYTIKYDSKTKRFFKGFAPKVGGFGIATAAWAGILGAAAIASGVAGLSIGLGATATGIIGGSVGLGAITQVADSTRVYAKNSKRKIFKAAQIGGTEKNPGTIAIIKAREDEAHKATLLLEQEDKKAQEQGAKKAKKIPWKDGVTYSRRGLIKRIKEKEDIAYHGLKYILEQGIYISKKIEDLQSKINLTEYEEERLQEYNITKDRISECVYTVASKRLHFNPYKELIIDAMEKGCLLGNYNQDNKIREVALLRDREKTLELYFEMYEKDLLEKGRVKPKAKPQIDRREHEYLKQQNQELSRRVAEAESKSAEQSKQLNNAKKVIISKNKKLNEAQQESQIKDSEIERLEDNLEILLSDWYQEDLQNKQVQQDSTRIIEKLTKEKLSKQRAIDHLSIEIKGLLAQNKKLDSRVVEVVDSYNELVKAFKEERLGRLEFEKQIKVLTSRLAVVGKKKIEQKGTIKAQQDQIDTLTKQRDRLAADNHKKTQRVENLEIEQEILRNEKEVSEETAINLGYSVNNLQRQLDEMTTKNKADEQYISDLEEEVKKRGEVVETLNLALATIQGAQAQHEYNFKFGKVYSILNELIDKVEAHIEYTKENQINYNKQAVRYLEYFVADLRSKNPSELNMEEVKDFTKTLRAVYKTQKGSLENISADNLKKLANKVQNNRKKSTNKNLLV